MAEHHFRKSIFKSMLLVIVFLIGFQGLGYAAKASAAANLVQGIELSQKEIRPGDTSHISIQLDKTQLPDVGEVYITYQEPNGADGLYPVDLSYNEKTGKYEGDIKPYGGLFLSPGVWKSYTIHIYDSKGNETVIENSVLNIGGKVISQDLSAANFTIIAPKGWFYFEEAGLWFYFDPQTGHLAKGWLYDQNKWYYLDEDGVMERGWVFNQGKWYYMDMNGAMTTGWVSHQNKWYYLQDNGAMKTGWLWNSGQWYYLENSGAMKSGWLSDKGSWYYLNANGAMTTGWQSVNSKWYYLYNDGRMAANTTIDGYKLGADGAWIR